MRSSRLFPFILSLLTAALHAGDASAHQPGFSERTLWPNLTGKEPFATQVWPKGRLLVWAKPGEHGSTRGLDPTDPANWLEDGRPATALFDAETDVLLPASVTPYTIDLAHPGHGKESSREQVWRHATIESGASFSGGGDGVGKRFYGNVWVKPGGSMYSQGATRVLGDRHTFLRNDNALRPGSEGWLSSQYFNFAKTAGASCEVIGNVAMLDEFSIDACTVVVGVDSKLMPGRNATPVIQNGGVLAILDGGHFALWANNLDSRDLEVTGTIQGGLPDRPLRRDATLGLNFKNHSKSPYDLGGKSDKKMVAFTTVRVPSLIMHPGSALRSHSADGKALLTLVCNAYPFSKYRPDPGGETERKALAQDPGIKRLYDWFDAIPRGLDCWFAATTTVDGVRFDGVRAGGLLLADPAQRSRWQRVEYGTRNLAAAAGLFSTVPQLTRGGGY